MRFICKAGKDRGGFLGEMHLLDQTLKVKAAARNQTVYGARIVAVRPEPV